MEEGVGASWLTLVLLCLLQESTQLLQLHRLILPGLGRVLQLSETTPTLTHVTGSCAVPTHLGLVGLPLPLQLVLQETDLTHQLLLVHTALVHAGL